MDQCPFSISHSENRRRWPVAILPAVEAFDDWAVIKNPFR